MRSKMIDTFFRLGMYWRIIYGTLRLIVGVALLRLVGSSSADIFRRVVGRELLEDPGDPLLRIVRPFMHHFSFSITYFIAAYLIFWGIIDIALSVSLLNKKLWAFPLGMGLIAIFVLYEIYRFLHTHSTFLLVVIVVDLAIIWVIRGEYRKLLQARSW